MNVAVELSSCGTADGSCEEKTASAASKDWSWWKENNVVVAVVDAACR